MILFSCLEEGDKKHQKSIEMKAYRFSFSNHEADASCECCARKESGGTATLEGNSEENVGVSVCVSKNRFGDSGESAGEPKVVSSGAAEGMIEIVGESAIEGDAAAAGETGEIEWTLYANR